MINNKKVMAIIPARGGSKRLPGKNILPIAGKPLISWSIEAAKNSKYIDNIFVSTDDQKIADIVTKLGINIPELRPRYLASDTASTASVLIYTLENFATDTDIVVLLQPTSPLRTTQQIDEAIELFINKNASSVVSVNICEHPPTWANTLPANDNMGSFINEEGLRRSQEQGDFYRINGAIYIFDVNDLLLRQKIEYTDKTFAYKIDVESSIDIDSHIDFRIAEFLLKEEI